MYGNNATNILLKLLAVVNELISKHDLQGSKKVRNQLPKKGLRWFIQSTISRNCLDETLK